MPRLPAARILAATIACVLAAPLAAQEAAPADAPSRAATAPGDGIDLGPLRLRPGLGLTVGYDDNLNLAARDGDASWLWTLSPGVRLEGGSERSRLRATLSADITRHASSPVDDYEDYEDYGIDLAWVDNPRVRHQFTVDAARRFGHDARGTAAREGELGLVDLDVDRFRRDDLGLRYRFGAPGARGRIEVDVRGGEVDYLNNRDLTAFRDRDDAGLGAAFFWRVAPRTSLLVRAERQRFDYELATLDSTESHWFIGAEYEATARSTGAAMVGRASKRFEDPSRSDFDGATWRALGLAPAQLFDLQRQHRRRGRRDQRLRRLHPAPRRHLRLEPRLERAPAQQRRRRLRARVAAPHRPRRPRPLRRDRCRLRPAPLAARRRVVALVRARFERGGVRLRAQRGAVLARGQSVTFIARWLRPAQDPTMRAAILLLLSLLSLLSAVPAWAADDAARGYRLGTGDRIAIAVFGEPELAVEAKVGDSGRIASPFIGELRVAGRTPAEVEKALAEALRGDWLVDPKVSVAIVEYRPFFINGQVRSPGSYAYQPGLTVRKAVSTAGGFTERASERAITLIPEGERDRGKGRTVGLDDPVGPGDILTVGESFF